MPKNVYLPEDESRRGGGVAFTLSWERLELILRGAGTQTHTPEIHADEECDFVITECGVTVYVDKKS
jgi:hypothetical protein